MREPTTEDKADCATAETMALLVAEKLGFTDGKAGGVVVIVCDHETSSAAIGHFGDGTPLYQGIRRTIGEILSKFAEAMGGGRAMSSVRKWREKNRRRS